jgi:hypothetical protein
MKENKITEQKIFDYVDSMLIGVKPDSIKSILRLRLTGILGLHFKQKEELENCKRELAEYTKNNIC